MKIPKIKKRSQSYKQQNKAVSHVIYLFTCSSEFSCEKNRKQVQLSVQCVLNKKN